MSIVNLILKKILVTDHVIIDCIYINLYGIVMVWVGLRSMF